jgi:hypothetical protein
MTSSFPSLESGKSDLQFQSVYLSHRTFNCLTYLGIQATRRAVLVLLFLFIDILFMPLVQICYPCTPYVDAVEAHSLERRSRLRRKTTPAIHLFCQGTKEKGSALERGRWIMRTGITDVLIDVEQAV